EGAWRRLAAIGGIGPWTIEKLAFHGQGRDDKLPAGDLAYLKLVGHLAGLGRRATVDEVRDFFVPYEPYAALAGLYMLHGRSWILDPDAPDGPGAARPRRRLTAGRVPAAARW